MASRASLGEYDPLGVRFRLSAPDRAIEVAIAIVIAKIQITRSVVMFKWGSGGRSFSDRKTRTLRSRSNGDRTLKKTTPPAGILAIEVSVIGCDR